MLQSQTNVVKAIHQAMLAEWVDLKREAILERGGDGLALEIDRDRLQQYLEAHVAGFTGPLSIRQFKGGQSNPTYLLTTRAKTTKKTLANSRSFMLSSVQC